MLLDLPLDVFGGILDILFGGYLNLDRLRTFCSLARTCKSIEALLQQYAVGPRYGWWKYYRMATVQMPMELTRSERVNRRLLSPNISVRHYVRPRVFSSRWGKGSFNSIQRKNFDLYSRGIIFEGPWDLPVDKVAYLKIFAIKVGWWQNDLAKFNRGATPGLIAARHHLKFIKETVSRPIMAGRTYKPLKSVSGYDTKIRGIEKYMAAIWAYGVTMDDLSISKDIVLTLFSIDIFRSHVSGHYIRAAAMKYFPMGIDNKKLSALGVHPYDYQAASLKIIKACLLTPNRTPLINRFLGRLINRYIYIWGESLGLLRRLFDITGSLPIWAARKIKYYLYSLPVKINPLLLKEVKYRLKISEGEKNVTPPNYWPSRIVDYTPRTLPNPTVDKKRRGKVVMDKYKKLQRGYKAAVRFLKGGGYRDGEYDCVDWWYLRFYEDHMVG